MKLVSFKKLIVIFFIIATSVKAEVPIFLVTIPKCGTHLLMKFLTLLTKKHQIWADENIYLTPEKFDLKSNQYLVSHALYLDHNINVYNEFRPLGIFVYRDPRDQVISFMRYAQSLPSVYPNLMKLSEEDLITRIILDSSCLYCYSLETFIKDIRKRGGIDDLYQLYLPWKNLPSFYSTSFENIIGSKGGSSDEIQFNELKSIAHFLGYDISDIEIQVIQDKLFGGTVTFREGSIGAWRNYFSSYHKELFKRVAGNLLIELGYEYDDKW